MPFYLTRLLLVVKWYKDSVFQNSFASHVGASLSKMWNSSSSYTSVLPLWGPVGLDCTVWECALLLLNMEISSCRLIKSKAHICCLFVAALLTTRYSINGCCFFVVVAQTGEYRFGIPLLYYIKMYIYVQTLKPLAFLQVQMHRPWNANGVDFSSASAKNFLEAIWLVYLKFKKKNQK